MNMPTSKIPEIVRGNRDQLLDTWMQEQLGASSLRSDLLTENELRQQSREFLDLLQAGLQDGSLNEFDSSAWRPMREFLAELSRSRAHQGFNFTEVATFIFSFKQPLFQSLRKAHRDANDLTDDLWTATNLIEQLGLYTTESFMKSRDDIIARQRQEMLELSTPVVKLWEGVLALPLIGTLDSERTQIVMESLLQKIVETGATTAIIDITGVPTVDTLVAQHLLKTVAAAQLMGADCIISGIRPQIAQTIIHLGIDLSAVSTKASLADAFTTALRKTGHAIAPSSKQA